VAERVLQHVTTIPAGTPDTAPWVEALGFHDWDVERIDLIVPPGPAGTMGFYLANNGVPWVPRALNEWLVFDDRELIVVPTGYPTGTGWQIVGYNDGKYDHDVIALFHVNAIDVAARQTVDLPVLTFIEHDVKPLPVVTL
jgi:hypothetical protein